MSDKLAIDTLRFLAADMVQAANSGHPGMPMGAAPMAWTLWSRHLKHDPADPTWDDRDRFVLSAGHGSALLYGLLHIFGYGLPESELRNFRQLGSKTPGHPEFGHTPGVESTTGPLGQGLAMAVGMALAERLQNARYPDITDHHTYVIVGDGCLMEGVSHEAASQAGHLGLGRLIVLWDDNSITIDGSVDRASNDDQVARFAAHGWHTEFIADGTDVDAIDEALTRAKSDPRPSFIGVRTVIGQGAPGIEGTSKAHGSPLGEDVLAETKKIAGWDYAPFEVPPEVAETCATLAKAGAAKHAEWDAKFAEFEASKPSEAAQYRRIRSRQLPEALEVALDATVGEKARATRQSSQAALSALHTVMPELIGGSADLAGSTGTAFGELITRDHFAGTEIAFGIREFGMTAALNGMSLHGLRPFGSTFLVFADYLRPALRLAALMHQPIVLVLTHDSIAVGEDGPTHEPVEQIESLRVIPGLQVLRPADDAQTAEAWKRALERTDGPTALILSRQGLPQLDPATFAADDATLEIVATGSEVSLAVATAEILRAEGVSTRVVSVLDRSEYRPTSGVTTVSVEAGVTDGWRALVDLPIGIDHFGDSGKGDEVMAHHGFTPEKVAERIREFLGAPR